MALKDTEFYNKFYFNIFKFNRYHFTDNSKTPIANHYFGCLIKGTVKIKTQAEELLLKPNEIFYIPKGLTYQSYWFGENGEEIQFYSFGFEFSPINKPFVLQKVNCSDNAQKLFNEICDNARKNKKSIGKLYSFFEEVSDSMRIAEKSHVNPILQCAIEYMQNNPNLKISDISKYCHISEPGIYSLFKKHLNKTPNELRNEILCKKAVSLLTTTNKSVQEISDDLNFSSTSYFRKILKAYTNKTPLQIRKETEF